MRTFFGALACRVIYVALALAVGIFRDAVLRPRLDELRAHQIAFVLVALVVLGLSILFIRAHRLTPGRAIAVGSLWLVLGLSFQVAVFHVALGRSWRELLADYDLMRGRLWALVPLTQLLAPWITARLGVPRSRDRETASPT